MVTHTIGTVLGPIVIGTNINFFLFGIVLYQFSIYYSSQSKLQTPSSTPLAHHTARHRDPWPIQMIVWWLLLLDTYHTSVCGYMQWQYTIDHFSDPEILKLATWPYSSTPIVTILASVTVQCFLAWRIRIITRRNLWALLIVILSIIQGLGGLGTGIGALWVADIDRFWQLEPVAGVWFCAQVACDALITTTLVLTLNRERTGFKQTDNVIDRLIKGAVETACFATIFCLLDLAMFFAESGNNLHLAFALPMGRIYSNTLLATLNARSTHRSMLASPEGANTYQGGVAMGRRGLGELVFRRSGASVRGVGSLEKGVGSPRSPRSPKSDGVGIKVSIQHDVELEPRSSSPPSSPSSDKTDIKTNSFRTPADDSADIILPAPPPVLRAPTLPAPAYSQSQTHSPALTYTHSPALSHPHHSRSHSVDAKSAFSASNLTLPMQPTADDAAGGVAGYDNDMPPTMEGLGLVRGPSTPGVGAKATDILGRSPRAKGLNGMIGGRPGTGLAMGLPDNCT